MHDFENEGAKRTATGIGLFVSAVMLAGAGYMNARFAYNLGRTPLDSAVFAAIGVAIDIFLALSPFFFFSAIRAREWFGSAITLLLWLGLAGVSANAAIGHIAGSRLEAMSGRVAATTSYQDTRAELKRLNDRLGWLPKPTDSEGSLRAKIKAHQSQPIWLQTQECANQWSKPAKDFCAKHTELTSALTNVIEYDRTVVRINELQTKSDTAATNHVGVLADTADAQAGLYAKALGADPTTISGLLSLFVALVILLGASMGFYIALTPQRAAARTRSKAAAASSAALATEGGILLDISPSPVPALAKAPTAYIAPPRDLEPGGKELLRAIGMPEAPCDRREKDSRDVLGWRFYAYLVARKHVGDHSADDIDVMYEAFSIADNRVAWGMRIVKSELEAIGQRYVSSGLRIKEDGSRGTVWSIKPIAYAKLMDLLRKRGIATEAPKAPEPPSPAFAAEAEPAVETPAPKNVLSFFKRGPDTEAPKKATNG